MCLFFKIFNIESVSVLALIQFTESSVLWILPFAFKIIIETENTNIKYYLSHALTLGDVLSSDLDPGGHQTLEHV